jgi:DNA-binding CsgD family transcriptional regulator
MQALEPNPRESRLAGDGDKPTARQPVLGFLVADASLKLLCANNEAIAILTYPEPSSQSLADVFHRKVRPGLLSAWSSPTSRNDAHPIIKLRSGRRTYFCRPFLLTSNGKGGSSTVTLLVLERGTSGPLALSQVSKQFHLTHREQEAVALLLQGFGNKEIAESMGISAHTVKAFLRMATIKMGVSNRAGIATKVLQLLLSSINSGVPITRITDRSSEA